MSSSVLNWREEIVQIAPEKRRPEEAGGQMTRRRSLGVQYLSPGPGAPSSLAPKEERGGTGVLLHQSAPRSAVVVPAE